jgi:hypothetical protein
MVPDEEGAMVTERAQARMTPDEWLTRTWMRDVESSPGPGRVQILPTGGIVGNVVDGRGRAVPARVTLRGEGTAAEKECSPIDRKAKPVAGWFHLCDLPAGRYVLTVEAEGFHPERCSGIQVEAYGITAVGTIRLTAEPSRIGRVVPRLFDMLPARLVPRPRRREAA